MAFEKQPLSDADLDQCYKYLLEDIELERKSGEDQPKISFSEKLLLSQESATQPTEKCRLKEIKDLVGINAISETCSIWQGRFD